MSAVMVHIANLRRPGVTTPVVPDVQPLLQVQVEVTRGGGRGGGGGWSLLRGGGVCCVRACGAGN
jgi:hypothetical protein